jgi:ABC-type dipeptide/oligopeptide/nickel transport system permease subunit
VLSPTVYSNPRSSTEYYTEFLAGHTYTLFASSKDPNVNLLATGTIFPANFGSCDLSQGIFRHLSNISVSYTISSLARASILVSNVGLHIQGSAYGVLGTDDLGRSVWSQFVYGARVSLAVGHIAVVIGTLVGLVAGYLGGFVDEILMRFTDFMLTIPFLPFVLILFTIIQVAQIRIVNQEFVILILIAVFSWQDIARIIRS